MSELAKQASRNYLEKMGVTIITETFVKTYDGEVLELSNGNQIVSKTVIWAAGVTGNTIKGLPETVIKAGQRLNVNRMNLIEGLEDVYAIGDIAYMETAKYPKAHPQLANVAINQAKNVASNLAKISRSKQPKEFEYKDLGSMATIGKNKAVVDLPFYKFKGYFAWLTWMFLHLMLILSVRNKLIIFINWAWAYISRDSSLWLILKKDKSE
jgi:NADH dehydrogenase